MKEHQEMIDISPSIGQVSSIAFLPGDCKSMIILGHGAGAGMNHRFMSGLSHALADLRIATIRYNFPYMENKKGRPDVPMVAQATILAVIKHTQQSFPGLRLFIAGKSFGGRMGSQTMANQQVKGIEGLIFYGFPLHSPAKPGIERADHLFGISIPMLFLQGDRDTLARMDLLQPLLDRLPLAKLKIFEGADHSFKFPKKAGINEAMALSLLASETKTFVDSVSQI
jgi:predicted alpha/beta-hydrolase family hydrolase